MGIAKITHDKVPGSNRIYLIYHQKACLLLANG